MLKLWDNKTGKQSKKTDLQFAYGLVSPCHFGHGPGREQARIH